MASSLKTVRVLFAGGGTGGHIYPIVAVADALARLAEDQNLALEMRYFGAYGDYEEELARHHIRASSIASSKLRRYVSLGNIVDIPKFFWSVLQAFTKVFFMMPDVIFSKGGPGSLPVVIAGWWYRVPVLIHESDAIPGLANRIAGRFARKVAIAFPAAAHFFHNPRRVAFTGNPVRPFFITTPHNSNAAKGEWGLGTDLPVLFFVGGSQGARRINDFIFESLELFLQEYQIIHQLGAQQYKNLRSEVEARMQHLSPRERVRYRPVPYLTENIASAMSAADLIVSRAGAGFIFEIAAMGKPAILIPLPSAANNHQRGNAYGFAEQGAAVVIEEDNFTPHVFLTETRKILGNPSLLQAMRTASLAFAKPHAAWAIAEEILSLAR